MDKLLHRGPSGHQLPCTLAELLMSGLGHLCFCSQGLRNGDLVQTVNRQLLELCRAQNSYSSFKTQLSCYEAFSNWPGRDSDSFLHVARGAFNREGTYVCLWLIHVDIWHKPTQYCKAIILQLKINKNLKDSPLDQHFPLILVSLPLISLPGWTGSSCSLATVSDSSCSCL